MADNTQIVKRGGIGILGWLTLIFVVAKIVEIGPVAAWSWWLVFSPLLVGAGLGLFIFLLVVAFGILALMVD